MPEIRREKNKIATKSARIEWVRIDVKSPIGKVIRPNIGGEVVDKMVI